MVRGELKSLRITLEAIEPEILGYVYLREIHKGQATRNVMVETDVVADYDDSGTLLGVEFLHAELADAALMRKLAARLNAPELAGLDLAEMCKIAS